ncbi:MAG TPA: DinB family protein [Thermoanaerobaculia bacterium]|nr:DinB family protein [Thermoanaerobaculia bacterium]
MTTNREFFMERWEKEQAAFRKVLGAVPGDQLRYSPHEKSTTAGDLACQLAQEQQGMVDLVQRGEMNYEAKKCPPIDQILAEWDRATNELRQALASSDEAKWSGPAKFLAGGATAWEDTLQNIMWGFFFDMIHHRGQLSTYLRPMGSRVPSIYGPSADDHGS